MNFEQLVSLCHETHHQLLVTANRVIETHLAARNFLIGLYIVHFEQEGADRARYGNQTLKALSEALRAAVGRGFSVDNLELMRRFYLQFRSSILPAPISETASRKFLPEASEKSETLSRILAEKEKSTLPSREMVGGLPSRFTLGWSQYVELLTLDDPKRDKLTHQDLGQMQMYVNYFDRHVRQPDELPTVGIVLCHRKNDALVELTLPPDANIFASKYQLYLPSKEELKTRLTQITHELEGGQQP